MLDLHWLRALPASDQTKRRLVSGIDGDDEAYSGIRHSEASGISGESGWNLTAGRGAQSFDHLQKANAYIQSLENRESPLPR
jgi:hypothetical protein